MDPLIIVGVVGENQSLNNRLCKQYSHWVSTGEDMEALLSCVGKKSLVTLCRALCSSAPSSIQRLGADCVTFSPKIASHALIMAH